MEQKSSQIITISHPEWQNNTNSEEYIKALESGKVLHFTNLKFPLSGPELKLFTPNIRDPKSRNISLNIKGELKGAVGDEATLALLTAMIKRFSNNAKELIYSYFPNYQEHLILAPTSFRPSNVENRKQSWRGDDKRLHVDAFPSRPNNGTRILRVFINLNPDNIPRVWRVGEPFLQTAQRFLNEIKPYSPFKAKLLNLFGITKSLRSEYDHIMLGLHDAMKKNLEYQKTCSQITIPFPTGSVWVCFSDQTAHAAMSGQYMMEQTFHLPYDKQYDLNSSPIAILKKATGRELI